MASPALKLPQQDFQPQWNAMPLPALDLVHLARQSLGDRALEAELLQLFDRQASHILDRLADPTISDPKRRADMAHTLKGSARTVGAHAVAAAAETYEQAAALGSSAQPEALRNLSKAARQAQAAIRDLLDN